MNNNRYFGESLQIATENFLSRIGWLKYIQISQDDSVPTCCRKVFFYLVTVAVIQTVFILSIVLIFGRPDVLFQHIHSITLW